MAEDDDCSFHGTDFDAIRMHHMREDSDSYNTEDDPHATLLNQQIFGPDNEAPVDEEEEEETMPPPKKKPKHLHSIAHEHFTEKELVFLSLDVETGGENVGLIQLLCVSYDPNANNPPTNGKDEFDEYIKPLKNVEAGDWNQINIELTGIQPNDEKMINASELEDVWPRFKAFCEARVPEGKVGCFVAWNGKGSDLKWLFKAMEEDPNETLQYPNRVTYFIVESFRLPVFLVASDRVVALPDFYAASAGDVHPCPA